MKNRSKFFLIAILYLVQYHLMAQINISVDRNCVDRNSAVLSKALITSLGEPTLKILLENDVNFVLIASVDSLGNIIEIHKFNSNNKMMSDSLKECIKSHLISNVITFFICYEEPLSSSALNTIKSDLRTGKRNNFIINIPFPGNLIALYDYDVNKVANGKPMPKVEYLKNQAKKLGVE